jgi:hypothetical protein
MKGGKEIGRRCGLELGDGWWSSSLPADRMIPRPERTGRGSRWEESLRLDMSGNSCSQGICTTTSPCLPASCPARAPLLCPKHCPIVSLAFSPPHPPIPLPTPFIRPSCRRHETLTSTPRVPVYSKHVVQPCTQAWREGLGGRRPRKDW